MKNLKTGMLVLALLHSAHLNAQSLPTDEATGAADVVTGEADGLVSPSEGQAEEVEASPTLLLPRDTPVHLMVLNEVSTKEHSAGHRFKLRVIEPVLVEGATAIPIGATAWGEVMSAEGSGNVGKAGRLRAELLYVEAGGVQIPIEAEIGDKGKSGTGETVMGVLALGVLGLLAKGNNAKIKAGERVTAFTAEDAQLSVSDAT